MRGVMQPTSDQLAAAVTAAANHELSKALDRIKHCLSQLVDEHVLRREADVMNSIGNLILHLCGNVCQWIVSGIGGEKDIRQRPKEFSERVPIPKADLLHRLEAVVAAAQASLKK